MARGAPQLHPPLTIRYGVNEQPFQSPANKPGDNKETLQHGGGVRAKTCALRSALPPSCDRLLEVRSPEARACALASPSLHHRSAPSSPEKERSFLSSVAFSFLSFSTPRLLAAAAAVRPRRWGGDRSRKMKKRHADASRLRRMKKWKMTERLSER